MLKCSGDNGFQTLAKHVAPMLKYRIMSDLPFNPYLTAGLEWFTFDPNTYEDFDIDMPRRHADDYSVSSFAIPYGIGFSNYFTDNLSFHVEAIYHMTFTDNIDDVESPDKNDNYATFQGGLTWTISTARDTDGDGIMDRDDADPLHAEDFDGFQDKDGAPDPDNDGDGVPDISDGAINDPEDRDGFQDKDGVPDPDNDGDGILDVNDGAPNAAEDFDGFQDKDGVPDPDNDRDGILDVDDGCPNAAETFNGYEDADGCPDTKPEIAVEAGSAIVLDGVTFAYASADLTAGSLAILDMVVRTLRDNEKIEVEIRGYTDNQGSQAANERFSQMRAEAVRSYLLENGISNARVIAVGYGPADPVASNDTEEGRAINRRIEFFRVK
jgi:outer membrane protein OmpA-like peptidoglycan-associated protein